MAQRVPTPRGAAPWTWDELTLLAAGVFGEARGEPYRGKLAMAYVALERVHLGGWYGDSIHGVLLRDVNNDGVPEQFSCFRPQALGGQLEVLTFPLDHEKEEVWQQCWAAASAARFAWEPNPVPGATHYHALNVTPAWAHAPTMIFLEAIGSHRFYRELRG